MRTRHGVCAFGAALSQAAPLFGIDSCEDADAAGTRECSARRLETCMLCNCSAEYVTLSWYVYVWVVAVRQSPVLSISPLG